MVYNVIIIWNINTTIGFPVNQTSKLNKACSSCLHIILLCHPGDLDQRCAQLLPQNML